MSSLYHIIYLFLSLQMFAFMLGAIFNKWDRCLPWPKLTLKFTWDVATYCTDICTRRRSSSLIMLFLWNLCAITPIIAYWQYSLWLYLCICIWFCVSLLISGELKASGLVIWIRFLIQMAAEIFSCHWCRTVKFFILMKSIAVFCELRGDAWQKPSLEREKVSQMAKCH